MWSGMGQVPTYINHEFSNASFSAWNMATDCGKISVYRNEFIVSLGKKGPKTPLLDSPIQTTTFIVCSGFARRTGGFCSAPYSPVLFIHASFWMKVALNGKPYTADINFTLIDHIEHLVCCLLHSYICDRLSILLYFIGKHLQVFSQYSGRSGVR